MQDRVLAVLVAAILVAAPSAAFGQADGKKYEGRAVADVLKELQATRLKIIFSSELVPPALRVVKEPRGDGAKDIALQILEPHGLTLQQGPGGTFLVVAAPRRKQDPRPPAPARPIPSRHHRRSKSRRCASPRPSTSTSAPRAASVRAATLSTRPPWSRWPAASTT